MNNKKKNTSNLIFSAFLVTAFVICAYFFSGIITSSTAFGDSVKNLFMALIFLLFGLFLFYATRVGDGKQVRRFSLSTLIIMDLPALYIILASAASGLPFSTQIASCNVIVYLAGIVLGYGIPYTFVSGYEQQLSDSDEQEETKDENSEDKESLLENTEDTNFENDTGDETDTDEDTMKLLEQYSDLKDGKAEESNENQNDEQ